MTTCDKKVKFVLEKSKKPRIYTYDVFLALKRIWTIFDFICGKMLAPFITEAVEKLPKHKELDMKPIVRKKPINAQKHDVTPLVKE